MHFNLPIQKQTLLLGAALCLSFMAGAQNKTESNFVKIGSNGKLQYIPDEQGNIIPDFSRVGYYACDKPIPTVAVAITVTPTDNAQETIQAAIDELSKKTPDANGFRGAILLKKGVYKIPGSIKIEASGIVLRGEGNETKLVATGKGQRALIIVSGKGNIQEAPEKVVITDAYVPTGATSLRVTTAAGYRVGDNIIVYRPGTAAWIHDLKMDSIQAVEGTKQWEPKEYNFRFERIITKIEGNTIFIDNPIVMSMETKYGGGEIYKYTFNGRLTEVGIEDLYCESEYANDTDEDHGWDAVLFNKIRNGWVRNVTSRYFGYSCVNLNDYAANISVLNCNCLDAKSQITGGRRYSFNNTGQLNLFMDCNATEGRHDYVTGAHVCGPNVFYNCTAKNTHADIGPHHRWAMGTLYDNITTDGEINIQDRGNWGTGHGWSGVTQILWNCTAKDAAVQNPWVSGKNYNIGFTGAKVTGRLKGRPEGEWDQQNKKVLPVSLYVTQLKERQKK
ncbi:hypothetical protein ACI6Q2_21155 [Chitinophagaceae bacterium LWZ2-11]